MSRIGRDAQPRMMLWLTAGVLIVTTAGCASALATAVYLVRGTNEPAEFDELKEKRVAVVCRPMAELEYSSSGAAAEISTQVVSLLKEHIRKINVISPDEVARWTDENSWSDYTEIGQALEADMVLGIDLESFKLFQSQTLYQGQATVHLQVFDMKKGGDIVFQKDVPRVVYPPNAPIDTKDMMEDQFRSLFVAEVADHIGRYFYPHDAHADMAKDSASLTHLH